MYQSPTRLTNQQTYPGGNVPGFQSMQEEARRVILPLEVPSPPSPSMPWSQPIRSWGQPWGLSSTAPATVCMVCSNFKRGHCLRGKSNCTMEQGPGCRTRDFFIFTDRGNAVEPGSAVLSRPLTWDVVQGCSRLRRPWPRGACVCRPGVVGGVGAGSLVRAPGLALGHRT